MWPSISFARYIDAAKASEQQRHQQQQRRVRCWKVRRKFIDCLIAFGENKWHSTAFVSFPVCSAARTDDGRWTFDSIRTLEIQRWIIIEWKPKVDTVNLTFAGVSQTPDHLMQCNEINYFRSSDARRPFRILFLTSRWIAVDCPIFRSPSNFFKPLKTLHHFFRWPVSGTFSFLTEGGAKLRRKRSRAVKKWIFSVDCRRDGLNSDCRWRKWPLT